MTNKDVERAEGALRILETLQFTVKPLWTELKERVFAYENAQPTDLDLRYSVPTTAPSITSHFPEGESGEPQELRAEVMWSGYHYTLTKGQRKWFREFQGMIPSKTVTLGWIEVWPGTQCPRAFHMTSDVHVPSNLKGKGITSAVIRDVGAFFSKSAEFDAEEPVGKTLSLHVGDCKNWTTMHKWAVEDLVGVKLKGDVAIVFMDNEEIHFTDESGRLAKVDKQSFQETVTDYDRLHDKPKRVKGVKVDVMEPKGTLADLTDELDAEFGDE